MPDVTVIVGAYNALPYLAACLDSVLAQTLGPARIELIVVDDGSTDGTGPVLDRYAAEHPSIRVIHQPNSGGPGRPRNVALDQAAGRYVFFLDADDLLGPEALARLVSAADEYSSDIVLGKVASLGGRTVAQAMFRANEARADLFRGEVYRTLSCHKLFRREFVEQCGLRFAEDLAVGEDQMFTIPAYLNASVISVVADYDCYFLRKREDRGNISSHRSNPVDRAALVTRALELLSKYVEPGPKRDHLARRHLRELATQVLGPALLREPAERQAVALALAKEVLDGWYTPGVAELLRPEYRIRFELLRRDDPERLYRFIEADTLTVRLDELSWQGSVLRLAGRASTLDVEFVLRHRDGAGEHRWPAQSTQDGFVVDVDLARPLADGRWDAFLAVLTEEVRFGKHRAEALPTEARTRILPTGVVLTPYFTQPYGNLTIDVGETVHRLVFQPTVKRVAWISVRPPVLAVAGTVDLGRPGELPDPQVSIVVGPVRVPVHGSPFEAKVPCRLPYGSWPVSLELTSAGVTRTAPVTAPRKLRAIRWWNRGRPVQATGTGKPLTLTVSPLPWRELARRALRRLTA